MSERFIADPDNFVLKDQNGNIMSPKELKEYLKWAQENIVKNRLKKRKTKRFTEMISDSIVCFAIGDALGVPLEFKSREECEKINPTGMLERMSHYQPKGTWSDDTSMVLATIDSILMCEEINYNDIANKFCEWLNLKKYTARDEIFDVGNTTYKSLYNYSAIRESAEEFGQTDERSKGNGSLMRILPVSLYCHIQKKSSFEEKKDIIEKVSSITHATDECKLGCLIYSIFISNLLEGYTIQSSYEKLTQIDFSPYYSRETVDEYKRILNNELVQLDISDIDSGGYVVSTLEAVLWSLLRNNKFDQTLLTAIKLGGDTDTIAALTGALAGIVYNHEDIPEEWLNTLLKKEEILRFASDYARFLKTINNKKEYQKHLK